MEGVLRGVWRGEVRGGYEGWLMVPPITPRFKICCRSFVSVSTRVIALSLRPIKLRTDNKFTLRLTAQQPCLPLRAFFKGWTALGYSGGRGTDTLVVYFPPVLFRAGGAQCLGFLLFPRCNLVSKKPASFVDYLQLDKTGWFILELRLLVIRINDFIHIHIICMVVFYQNTFYTLYS